MILGHESVGRIEQVGAGLDRDWRGEALAVGDRVTWASSIVCGACFYCRVKRQPTRCLERKAYGISYSADEAPHLARGLRGADPAAGGYQHLQIAGKPADGVGGRGRLRAGQAVHGLERCPVEWGDAVVVQGTGPVGLAALSVARQSGAGRVIVIGGPPHRLEMARRFGADVAIDFAVGDPAERRRQVVEASGGYGADVVIECVGIPSAVNEGIELVRDGGKFLVLGQYANAGNIEFNPHTITRKQLEIRGSWGFEPRHVAAALRMLELGNWAELFAGQVTHRFPLEEANAALEETVRQWRSARRRSAAWRPPHQEADRDRRTGSGGRFGVVADAAARTQGGSFCEGGAAVAE